MVAKRMLVFLGVMVCLVGVGRAVMPQSVAAATGGSTKATTAANASTATTSDNTATESAFNIAQPHATTIPKEALRLRIIANSDSDADQNVKRDVRDAVVVQVAKLVEGAQNADEAKARVLAALPAIRQTALEVTRKEGYDYSVTADVGKVPFPTKVYGNQVYPAGTYEALRITLGKGAGQNWWCVLFPPLCFVDIASGDAVPNTGGFPDLPPLETVQVEGSDGQKHPVQVRLAVLDYGETVWKAVSQLWNHA